MHRKTTHQLQIDANPQQLQTHSKQIQRCHHRKEKETRTKHDLKKE